MCEENSKISLFEIIIVSFSVLFVSFICFIFIGIAKVDAASYASYIFNNPNFVQLINSSNTTTKQCNNTNVCEADESPTGIAEGFRINYNIASIDNAPMLQGEYSLNLSFRFTSDVTLTTNTSYNKLSFQVRNSSSGSYTSATCDGTEVIDVQKVSNNGGYLLTYHCSKIEVSSTVYQWLFTYNNTYKLNEKELKLIEIVTNLQIIDLNDPNKTMIDSNFQNTQDIINNQNSNTDKIVDVITGGELADDTPVNDDKVDDYHSAEDSLIDSDSLDKINDIDLAINVDANNYIWDIVTRSLNTNALVFGLMITMLSVGVIKLMLNR